MTELLSLVPLGGAMWLLHTRRCFHLRRCDRCVDRRVR